MAADVEDMSPTLEELGVYRLSIQQRIALAQEILDSVVADRPPDPLSEAKKLELKRRLADKSAGHEDLVPWDQIEADAQARFSVFHSARDPAVWQSRVS
jgi:putative addiction module component (TIGR02574 family)